MELYIVDAFTDLPFKGNPAAVCMADQELDTKRMQEIAMEMNLSETAFLFPEGKGYRLRWFTPKIEIKLCGHATLASSHILWETGRLPTNQSAHFYTLSGELVARREQDRIILNFPAYTVLPIPPVDGLYEALGIEHTDVEYLGGYGDDVLVVLNSDDTVKTMSPHFEKLTSVNKRGVSVTAQSTDQPYDIVSRFFAPRVGVPEDPVTGSAHCGLAPYWLGRLGKDSLTAYQASTRGGVLYLSMEGDRILLGGQAVTILQGTLNI
ncbi:PhzF family phenazine biosynthesis protein [Paenibacillus shirakamiensis]|uniref:PhzF family phenazine biosynthesis protein n=1 Tax=Paenibacillus shirakamiensis TaxID=1265935 RepID=A0ABS4JL89_9BACL|nr:PhzF family phenazine biosynthesis protein [Paenibacillus shirakamiensis]